MKGVGSVDNGGDDTAAALASEFLVSLFLLLSFVFVASLPSLEASYWVSR